MNFLNGGTISLINGNGGYSRPNKGNAVYVINYNSNFCDGYITMHITNNLWLKNDQPN